MYPEQCQKLYDRLESVLLAHKLIGRTHVSDSYCCYHEHACNNKPGINMFISDFKWELSLNPGDWLKVVLSSHFINSSDIKMIALKLEEKGVKSDYIEQGHVATFVIQPDGITDKDIEIMAEVTDLYLTLKY